MKKVRNRFGGFSGLFGTRVREAAPTSARESFAGNNKKERRSVADELLTPVPNNPLNPPNPFEALNSDG
jgi:hypothetical protein